MAQAKQDVEHVLRQNNLNTNTNGQHEHGNTNGGNNTNGASTPTLEDLADSDGEVESVFESKDDDDDDDDDYYYQEDNGGRPAYTAETVAAISSLMKGEESDAEITSGNGRSGGGGSGSGSGKQREISLQDRAAALVTVYRDFVQEEDDMNYEQEGGEGDVDENENASPPKNPFLDSNNQNQGPQHGKQVQVASTSTNSHDFRREEIKVATLEKFCKDVNVHDSTAAAASSDNENESSSSSSDDESSFSVSPSSNRYNNSSSISATIQEAEQGLLSFMMEEDNNMDISCGGRLTKGVQPYTPPPPKSQLPKPTAATTTAAFRLKAEVALKVRAVGSKTKNVAKKAVAKVAAGATTANKNRKAQKKEGGSKVMPATIDNDFDFQDYEQRLYTEDGEDDHEVDECYDPDDLEYGLSPSKVEGGLHRRTPSGQQQQMQTNGHTNDGNGDEDGDSTVYGMHILDRDQSLKHQISDENEDVGLFNELCDELGVTSDTHPGLLQHGNLKYFYRHPRTSRYRYPVFRSNKCKQALYYFGALLLLLAIGVSIISAVSNGFEEVRHRKAPPLPDWKSDEEWRERQKVDWEQSHPGDYVVGKEGWEKPDDAVVEGGGETTSEEEGSSNVEEFASISGQQQQQSSDNDMGKLFQKISAAYRPVWYDRETGWVGQTYSEALSWCSSHDGYIPCPYEVYCPNESTLLAGVMDNNGESWAPVINADNAWVQVGTGTPCELYSNKYGDHPVWGSNGLNNEAITRHIMCCREHPANVGDSGSQVPNKGEHDVVEKATGPPSGAASKKPQEETEQSSVISTSKEHKEEVDLQMLFLAMNKKYNPRGFNRNSTPSWKGQTYQEALDFCAHMQEYIPCPYEVYVLYTITLANVFSWCMC